MEKQPFFTIGISVYNTEKWIGDCLNSILSQNFTDFEIICIDDGSTDNSGAILDKYAKSDSRIDVIHRQNEGLPSGRNAVFSKASGKYIYFLDSDDTMCPQALSNAYNHLSSNNYPDILEVGFFTISGDKITANKAIEVGDDYFTKGMNNDTRTVKFILDGKFRQTIPAKFFKSEYIEKNHLRYLPHLAYAEDSEFIIRCRRCTDSIVSADFYVFNYYNPREGSQTTELYNPESLSKERRIKMYHSLLDYECSFYNDVQSWDIPEDYKTKLAQMHENVITNRLNFLLSILKGSIKKSVVLQYAEMIERFSKPQLSKVCSLSENKSPIFFMFKTIGVTSTTKLLYTYLKFKGVIKE